MRRPSKVEYVTLKEKKYCAWQEVVWHDDKWVKDCKGGMPTMVEELIESSKYCFSCGKPIKIKTHSSLWDADEAG